MSDAIVSQGFDIQDRQRIADNDYKDILVEEGAVSRVSKTAYQRSQKLNEFARQRYSDNRGKIICQGCGFEGSSVYGNLGVGLIEMHHLRPLYLREGEQERLQIEEAVKGVIPLCPNCHRIVHRNREQLLSLGALRKITRHGIA